MYMSLFYNQTINGKRQEKNKTKQNKKGKTNEQKYPATPSRRAPRAGTSCAPKRMAARFLSGIKKKEKVKTLLTVNGKKQKNKRNTKSLSEASIFYFF